MSEAELIEMSQRFRKLEELCAKADRYMATAQDLSERAFRASGRDHHEREASKIECLRDDIKAQMESCGGDLDILQEFIRRKAAA